MHHLLAPKSNAMHSWEPRGLHYLEEAKTWQYHILSWNRHWFYLKSTQNLQKKKQFWYIKDRMKNSKFSFAACCLSHKNSTLTIQKILSYITEKLAKPLEKLLYTGLQ